MRAATMTAIAFAVLASAAHAESAGPAKAKQSSTTASLQDAAPASDNGRATPQPTAYDLEEYGDNRLNSNG